MLTRPKLAWHPVQVILTDHSHRGPEKLAATPLGKVSLELFRILDINKALLYGEETILAQDDWLRQQPPVTGMACRDPLGSILTLMIHAATFNARLVPSKPTWGWSLTFPGASSVSWNSPQFTGRTALLPINLTTRERGCVKW